VLFLGGKAEIKKDKQHGGSIYLGQCLKGPYMSSSQFIELLKAFGVDVEKLNTLAAQFLKESAQNED